jgi:hypothetical protein
LNTTIASKTLRLLVAVLSLTVGLAGLLLHSLGVAADSEARVGEWLERWLPRRPAPPPPVVLVTIRDLGRQTWPWSGLDYAVFLNAIAPFQPAVVAMGIPLSTGQGGEQIFDRQFGQQIRAAGRVILPAIPLRVNPPADSSAATPGDWTGDWLAGQAPARAFAADACEPPPVEIATTAQIAPLLGPGVAGLPLVVTRQRRPAPTFALQTYASYLAADWSQSTCAGDTVILRDAAGRELARIPIDRAGNLRLRGQSAARQAPAAEFYQLIVSAEQIRNQFPPIMDLAELRGKILLVGTEAPGTYRPVHAADGPLTPIRAQYQALLELFQADFHRPLPLPWLVAAQLLITLAAGQLALTRRPALALPAGTLLMLASPAAAWLLASHQLTVPVVMLTGSGFVAGLWSVLLARLSGEVV